MQTTKIDNETKIVLLQAGSKVEVDYDTIDELKVCRKDFLASLENDIKPVSWYFQKNYKTMIKQSRGRLHLNLKHGANLIGYYVLL